MILREYLLRPDWLDSERVQTLPDHLQLFYLRLCHACDGAARFENDARILRPSLYPRKLHQVSERQVASNVLRMHEAGLVKLYTVRGRGYGEVLNYRQRDTKRRVLHPAEIDEDTADDLFAAAAPPPPERNGIEGKGSGARSAPAAPDSQEDWQAGLQRQYPEIDIATQIVAALAERHKAGKKLEREWFLRHWLPKCSQEIRDPREIERVRREKLRREAEAAQPPSPGVTAVFAETLIKNGF